MDAEDLTEEVFLKVWQRLAMYRDQGVPFAAFLLRVAHNTLIDHYRSSGRATVEPLAEESSLRNERFDLGDQVGAMIQHQELRHFISQLREDYRRVLVARFLSGLSPEETAQAMGKSAGAVRVLQHRALDALRKLLETNGSDYGRQGVQR
jgi:RNA polymerase sigma-70 factor (ECF subfamily)